MDRSGELLRIVVVHSDMFRTMQALSAMGTNLSELWGERAKAFHFNVDCYGSADSLNSQLQNGIDVLVVYDEATLQAVGDTAFFEGLKIVTVNINNEPSAANSRADIVLRGSCWTIQDLMYGICEARSLRGWGALVLRKRVMLTT